MARPGRPTSLAAWGGGQEQDKEKKPLSYLAPRPSLPLVLLLRNQAEAEQPVGSGGRTEM